MFFQLIVLILPSLTSAYFLVVTLLGLKYHESSIYTANPESLNLLYSNIALCSIYQNVCFITPQFFYAFFTSFSGQPLYLAFFLTAYNIFFTSLPIFVYGIFEQNVNGDALQSQPHLYRDISKNYRLSWTEFFFWVMSGYWHALVFFFGSYFFFQGDAIGPAMLQYGNWSFGTFVFTVCVIVSNLKLALVTHYWTWMTHVSTWGSIILFFVSTITYNSETWKGFQLAFSDVISLDMYKLFYQLLSQGVVWLAILLLIFMALLPDIFFMLVGRQFYPSETQRVQADRCPANKHKKSSVANCSETSNNKTCESMVILDYEQGSTVTLTSVKQ